MKVELTASVKAQMDKYKRFLEKPVLANHAVQLNNQFYYGVLYWSLIRNRSVGYIIMSPNGDLVPRADAIPVLKLLLAHNTSVHMFLGKFAIDKEKPVTVFEQIRDFLQGLLPCYENRMNEITRQKAQALIDVCVHMVNSQDQLRKIYDRGIEKHHQMLARGYFVEEDLTNLLDFFRHTDSTSNRELEQKRKKLIQLLGTYNRHKLKEITEKSIESFESDIDGKRTEFHSAQHLKEIYQKNNEIEFEKNIVPKLRNP
ncbi:hypothetical protein G3578_17910 [Brevibacillus sp. SYP-B805]|uniref:hypothetical protein n=1 Tax=Brevibacillus sp. SYP-B805 TaxID=1578199 RepID=UPI0013EDB6DD|nr:hypothetical protein [Brevibacillus sp. SYP-B805]NGQ97041.1 hypothetical protein [Brevibacillus sp. SYP-B805]